MVETKEQARAREFYGLLRRSEMTETALQMRGRINASLALPRTNYKQRLTKEFWLGFLTCAADYGTITMPEFRTLHNWVEAY